MVLKTVVILFGRSLDIIITKIVNYCISKFINTSINETIILSGNLRTLNIILIKGHNDKWMIELFGISQHHPSILAFHVPTLFNFPFQRIMILLLSIEFLLFLGYLYTIYSSMSYRANSRIIDLCHFMTF